MSKTIFLSNGFKVLVDNENYKYLMQWKWKYKKGYAVRNNSTNGKWKCIFMHKIIIDVPSNMEIDHINRNSLDNRRNNLRICNKSQNAMNRIYTNGTSQYKGVSWHKASKKWVAQIKIKQKPIWIGSFHKETDAAKAYDKKAKELFGEFSVLNYG